MKRNNSHNRISVVLLSWKRPKNIPIILKQLAASDLVNEIILWNNNPHIKLKSNYSKVIVIHSQKNFGTLARYCVSFLSQNETILIQDDDLVLTPKQIKIIYHKYKQNKNRLYGCFGRNIRSGKYIKRNAYGNVDIIIGRTIMFNKKHLFKFFKYLENFGSHLEDDILFSFSMKTKHKVIQVGEIRELPNDYALSKRPDHLLKRQKMVNYCLKSLSKI